MDFEIGGFESDFWGVYAVKTLVAECFFGDCGVGNGVVDEVVSVEKGGVGGEFYLHFCPCGVEINVADGVNDTCEMPSGVGNKRLQTDIADTGVGGERGWETVFSARAEKGRRKDCNEEAYRSLIKPMGGVKRCASDW